MTEFFKFKFNDFLMSSVEILKNSRRSYTEDEILSSLKSIHDLNNQFQISNQFRQSKYASDNIENRSKLFECLQNIDDVNYDIISKTYNYSFILDENEECKTADELWHYLQEKYNESIRPLELKRLYPNVNQHKDQLVREQKLFSQNTGFNALDCGNAIIFIKQKNELSRASDELNILWNNIEIPCSILKFEQNLISKKTITEADLNIVNKIYPDLHNQIVHSAPVTPAATPSNRLSLTRRHSVLENDNLLNVPPLMPNKRRRGSKKLTNEHLVEDYDFIKQLKGK